MSDDTFKVSHSKVKTWRRCRYLYHMKYVKKLRRKVKGRPLQFGSFVHEAIEEYQKSGNFKKTIKKFNLEIEKVFDEERAALGLDRLVEDATAVTHGYLETWADDGLTYKVVEAEVEIPLVDGIVFVGKVDAIVEDSEGYIWIFERKTCKTIPEEDIRLTDIQTVMYWWAVPNMTLKVGKRIYRFKDIRGIIWDYVRSKAPSIPEPLKKGGFSRANIDTTWGVYKQALLDNGLDPDDYEDMRQKLAGKEESFFRRIKLPYSKSMQDQVVRDFKETAMEMRILHGIAMDRNLDFTCSFCDFKNPCVAELRGSDIDLMLKKDYEVRKNENEIEEEKTSLRNSK